MLPLPLAFPTYIVAYVYVDLFDALGPVQIRLRALTGWTPGADSWYPNIRSLPRRDLRVLGFVLYPYVFLAARAMFQTQSACAVRGRAHARRDALHAGASRRAAAGAARARGRPRRSP